MNTHLTGFGLENFRVFKDYTWFDFAPITILTGPNNSGKSSLNRGLKLMCDPLRANSSELQLGGHDRVINKNSEKKDVESKISIPYWLDNYPTIGTKTSVKLEIFRSMSLTGSIVGGDKIFRIFLGDKLILESQMIGLSFYFDFATFYAGIKPLEREEYDQLAILSHQSEKAEDVLSFYSKSINTKQGEPKQGHNFDLFPQRNDYSEPEKEGPVNLCMILESFGLTPYQCRYIDQAIIGDINKVAKDIFERIKYLPFRGKVMRNYGLSEDNQWVGLIKKYQSTLEMIEHIGDDEEDLTILGGQYLFIKRWLQKFNVSEEIKPFIDNQFGFQSLEVNGRPLIEQGTGIAQIVYILLSIALNPEHDKIFLIEEPEANLHPKFQSLLADMFIDAAKTFDIQFIIETHSEYLIRKMQYLTAKKEVACTDTVIYYFHDPNNVPAGEPQVKKIEILEDGSLSSDFGAGFFDEATNWKFELMRLKNAQKN